MARLVLGIVEPQPLNAGRSLAVGFVVAAGTIVLLKQGEWP
jgi:hypothetical protein